MSRLNQVHLALTVAHSAGADASVLDSIMALCPDVECMQCSVIICPFDEPLHFHHDGCPQCSAHDKAVGDLF